MTLAKITDEEYSAILQLRGKLKLDPMIFTDGFLTRILWVLDMDLDRVNLNKNITEWVEANWPSTVFSQNVTKVDFNNDDKLEYFDPGNFEGNSILNSPGRQNLKKMCENGGLSEFIRFMAIILSEIEEECQEVELKNPGQVVIISLNEDGFLKQLMEKVNHVKLEEILKEMSDGLEGIELARGDYMKNARKQLAKAQKRFVDDPDTRMKLILTLFFAIVMAINIVIFLARNELI